MNLVNFLIGAITFFSINSFALDCKFENIEEYQDVPRTGYVKTAYTANNCEILPGLFVNKNTFVQWYKNGNLLGVSETAKIWNVNGKFQVDVGARVFWHENGQLYYLDKFINDTELAPGIWTRGLFDPNISSSVNWDSKGRVTWVGILGRPLLDNEGKVIALDCQTVSFLTDGRIVAGDLYICR
jgi:hypothetical protein